VNGRPSETFATRDGRLLWIRDSGQRSGTRRTVLLLHGWGGTSDLNWGHVYKPLMAAGFRVVASHNLASNSLIAQLEPPVAVLLARHDGLAPLRLQLELADVVVGVRRWPLSMPCFRARGHA